MQNARFLRNPFKLKSHFGKICSSSMTVYLVGSKEFQEVTLEQSVSINIQNQNPINCDENTKTQPYQKYDSLLNDLSEILN